MTSPGRRGAVSALRRSRAGAAALFVFLVLLVGAERRLAEAHFNGRTTTHAFESNDALDGDEIRVRLVALNDDKAPTVSDVGRMVAPLAAHVLPQRPPSVTLGRPAPRGPPAASSTCA